MAECLAIIAGTMVGGRESGWGLTGVSVWLPATVHSGIHDASSRDCGVLAQVQCPEKTEGESCLLAASALKPYLLTVTPCPITEGSYPPWLGLSNERCTYWGSQGT